MEINHEINNLTENKINDTIFNNPMERKLYELKMKVNAARKANRKEVVEEERRKVEPDYEKNEKRSKKNTSENNNEKKWTKSYIDDTIATATEKYKQEKKKGKNKASFGWDVFNQDSLYNAYKKRLKKLPNYVDEDEKTLKKSTNLSNNNDSNQETNINDGSDKSINKIVKEDITENIETIHDSNKKRKYINENEGIDRMVTEIKESIEKRGKFSRRRQFYGNKDVDYINERNRHFNNKIARAFDKYTVEIKQNLERGTAL